jgi:integrase
MASKPVLRTRKDGSTRWESTVSLGNHPVTGKRMQTVVTRRYKKDLLAETARIEAGVFNGTFTRPSDALVPELLDAFVKFATFGKEECTKVSYAHAVKPAKRYFAQVKGKDVRREDGEAFRDWMLSGGARVRGGKPLKPGTVNHALYLLSAAFDLAMEDGKVPRNPFRQVKRPRRRAAERPTWDGRQVRRFIEAASADRLYACWLISLLGPRRGEVCGALWEDADLDAGMLRIRHNRVQAGKRQVVKGPKSERGYRTLLLPGPVTAALKALRATQAAEKLKAGARYADSGCICADQLGREIRPSLYSIYFGRLAAEAGLPPIALNDLRHSSNSLAEHAGIPDSIRGRWYGHTAEVNKSVYTHAGDADLGAVRDALGRAMGLG